MSYIRETIAHSNVCMDFRLEQNDIKSKESKTATSQQKPKEEGDQYFFNQRFEVKKSIGRKMVLEGL